MQTCVPVEKRSKKRSVLPCVPTVCCGRASKLCPRIMRKKTDYSRKGRRAEVMDE